MFAALALNATRQRNAAQCCLEPQALTAVDHVGPFEQGCLPKTSRIGFSERNWWVGLSGLPFEGQPKLDGLRFVEHQSGGLSSRQASKDSCCAFMSIS